MPTTPRSTPQTTPQRLLAAAREEFASHGIAGARVDRIAERAGVNKQRIYGYFGSKEKLFDAVIADALDELARSAPLLPGEDPAEYVGRVYDYHRDNPTLLRLLLWEGLHYRENPLPNEDARSEKYRAKVAALSATLEEDPSAEVGMDLLSLIGLAAWPMVVPQMARMLTGAPTDTDEFRQTMRNRVVEFARHAMEQRVPAS